MRERQLWADIDFTSTGLKKPYEQMRQTSHVVATGAGRKRLESLIRLATLDAADGKAELAQPVEQDRRHSSCLEHDPRRLDQFVGDRPPRAAYCEPGPGARRLSGAALGHHWAFDKRLTVPPFWRTYETESIAALARAGDEPRHVVSARQAADEAGAADDAAATRAPYEREPPLPATR